MRSAGESSSALDDFTKAAKVKKRTPHRRGTKPFSIRLSDLEREMLTRDAGKLSVAAYVRQRLFGGTAVEPVGRRPSRKVNSATVDQVALGKVLAMLGRSDVYRSLSTIAVAARSGALPVTPDLIADLSKACDDIRQMREALMSALGLMVGSDR